MPNENSLAHYGVLGMRWGRRSGSKNQHFSKDHVQTSRIKKKKISQMSNDEIKRLATRIKLEQELKSLNPSKVKKGQKAVKNILAGIGALTAAAGTITVAVEQGKKIYKAVKGG